jgi:hypothetical protein
MGKVEGRSSEERWPLWGAIALTLLVGVSVSSFILSEKREAYTELYLPPPIEESLPLDSLPSLPIHFVVANHEGETIEYLYRVSFDRIPPDGAPSSQILAEGRLRLNDGEKVRVSERVWIPELGEGDSWIRVTLKRGGNEAVYREIRLRLTPPPD